MHWRDGMKLRYAIFKKPEDEDKDPLLVEEFAGFERAKQKLIELSSNTAENYALFVSGREIVSTADAGYDKFEIRKRLFFAS
jgi:hypothetical protein